MFTGLVGDLGRVESVERSRGGVRLRVGAGVAGELAPGDSVAVNGVCLPVVATSATAFTAEVMNETLSRTTLAEVADGTTVNLELPLRPTDRLGGHFVQGHVDGVGTVDGVEEDGLARRVVIDAPPSVLRYIVERGSIAVDGVSLTVAGLDEGSFTVSLIPETVQRTNLGGAEPGTGVNLEVDVLAKYVERLIEAPT